MLSFKQHDYTFDIITLPISWWNQVGLTFCFLSSFSYVNHPYAPKFTMRVWTTYFFVLGTVTQARHMPTYCATFSDEIVTASRSTYGSGLVKQCVK